MPVKWPYLLSLVLLGALSFYLFYPKIENFFIFYPVSSFAVAPEALHLPYKDAYFTAEDGTRLHGWLFPKEGELPVLVFCHGNAGNISHRLENIMLLLEKNFQVFIFDYRGYGKSAGKPSEEGLYLDGLAAYDYLVQEEQFSPKQVILFGRSLGAAVAVEVSLKREIRSLIIEGAFLSTKEMAKTMLLFSLLSPVLPAHYNNLRKIAHVDVPKLIIHGEADEIIPFYMGKELFEASNAPKYFYPLKGARHNDTYVVGGEEYFQTLAAFAKDSKI